MDPILATVTRLPVRQVDAQPGDRIRCSPEPPELADFQTLFVCWSAFWQFSVGSRRYSNVVREVRRALDRLDVMEDEPPAPDNHARAVDLIAHALAQPNSPLTLVERYPMLMSRFRAEDARDA